jgi:hypothetical protein
MAVTAEIEKGNMFPFPFPSKAQQNRVTAYASNKKTQAGK